MSRKRQIYFVLTLASECYNDPDHFEKVWSNGISKLIDRWNPIFTDGYEAFPYKNLLKQVKIMPEIEELMANIRTQYLNI